MFCTKCGAENLDKNKFCIKCGNPLVGPIEAENQKFDSTTNLEDQEPVENPTIELTHNSISLIDINQDTFEINNFPCVIGRGQSADVVITNNGAVSREHAKIHKHEDDFVIEDLNSVNGTLLNGFPLEPEELVVLHNGSTITFADCEFKVYIS